MIEDCLKLTAYFGERQRTGSAFLADALLDLCGEREIATSILLRGVGGFGLRHHLRTDQSLSLSEDPPVVAVAVDTRQRIEGLLGEVLKIKRRGLLTLERARMLGAQADPLTLPEDLPADLPKSLYEGPKEGLQESLHQSLREATKLTIYVGRQDRVSRVPAYLAICDLLHRRGMAGASVLLGVDGTAHGQRRRAHFFDRNADVPMMVIAVGSGERIAKVLPELTGLLKDPLITLERVRVCKRDGELFERPHALPGVDGHGLGVWQKITVYSSESALYDRQPIHRTLIARLRASDVARGATALRGVWGFHGDHEPHGDRLFQLARHVPVTTIIIDTPEHIARSFDIIEEVTGEHGLVTSEMVPTLLSLDGATPPRSPPPGPPTTPDPSNASWQ